jgi:prepilin-type N-terminal cleavage/methylation domain-containing protein
VDINKKNGFTLVELLVVISIIGLLSSFAVVSLNSARVKARDALRKGEMAQLRTALSLYYDDNGRYPVCDGDVWDPSDQLFGTTIERGSDCYLDPTGPDIDVTETTVVEALSNPSRPIMPDIPTDPRNENNETVAENPTNGSNEFIYLYVSDPFGLQYAIVYRLEEDPLTWTYSRGY